MPTRLSSACTKVGCADGLKVFHSEKRTRPPRGKWQTTSPWEGLGERQIHWTADQTYPRQGGLLEILKGPTALNVMMLPLEKGPTRRIHPCQGGSLRPLARHVALNVLVHPLERASPKLARMALEPKKVTALNAIVYPFWKVSTTELAGPPMGAMIQIRKGREIWRYVYILWYFLLST